MTTLFSASLLWQETQNSLWVHSSSCLVGHSLKKGGNVNHLTFSVKHLGVLFEPKESIAGTCHVTNTASRVDEVSGEIHRVIEQGFITQLEA